MDNNIFSIYFYNQVTCIDKQIEELEARKAARLAGTCYIGPINSSLYMDPYKKDTGFSKEI